MNNWIIFFTGFLIGAPVWSTITIYLISYLENRPKKPKPNYSKRANMLLTDDDILDEYEQKIS